MILRQSDQKSMKSMYSHSVILNYCVAYVYIDGLDSLNRTREIIYSSRCGCYRSICHIIASEEMLIRFEIGLNFKLTRSPVRLQQCAAVYLNIWFVLKFLMINFLVATICLKRSHA